MFYEEGDELRNTQELWNNCLELELCSWSKTGHGIYKLDGEVTKTVISGDTSNISQFCEFEWGKWVVFQDKMAHILITISN